MFKTAKVTTSYKGVGEVLRSEKTRHECTRRAEPVLSTAKSGAPVDTGAYRDGLHIEQLTTDRAVTRVSGSTDHDFIVEANTGNLARSLDQARGS
jgi:hypothetical protein